MSHYTTLSSDRAINIKATAKQVVDLVGLEEGTVIKISSGEYNIIRDGVLKIADVSELDETMVSSFEVFEKHLLKPKYPYTVIIEDMNEVNDE